MSFSNKQSLTPDFFEDLYKANPDPWQFETSEYEAQKYTATLNALPHALYQSGFEIGGSIGILTEKLAQHCQSLLSVDVSKIAQDQARQRCQHLSNIDFQMMSVPQEFPDQSFDLIILSEVGYYWALEDLRKAQTLILEHLQSQGHLLLVHWIVDAKELPLTGDEVHDSFLKLVPHQLNQLKSLSEEKYRLDVFEKT
jgi:2-polyprenyl-3-methyl-5-hydroxy-6-metoxy-1,4-benzoquinol methylase